MQHFGRQPDDARQAKHMQNVIGCMEPEWRNDPSYFWGSRAHLDKETVRMAVKRRASMAERVV
jgi:hypothetical protein